MQFPRLLILVAAGSLVAGCQGPSEGLDFTTTDRGREWASRLIEPLTQPYLFESPVIESNVRPIYIRHNFPSNNPVFGGGKADIFALQARVALSDRFAIIAPVDGYIYLDADNFPDASGEGDIAAGVKYAFIDDLENGRLVTGGLIYHSHSGDHDLFQGTGSGAWRPFVTVGIDCDEWNTLGTVGAYLPEDGGAESQYIDWHIHTSYELTERFAPLVEVNGLYYTNNGNALPISNDGGDYTNLGAANVDGNNVISAALGFRYRISDNLDFGAGYESGITNRDDFIDDRVTIDLVYRF